MQARDTSSTNWSSSDIPSQGKEHSRPEDNFRDCFPGQSASLMRCLGGKVPVKIMLKDSEANVKQF